MCVRVCVSVLYGKLSYYLSSLAGEEKICVDSHVCIMVLLNSFGLLKSLLMMTNSRGSPQGLSAILYHFPGNLSTMLTPILLIFQRILKNKVCQKLVGSKNIWFIILFKVVCDGTS